MIRNVRGVLSTLEAGELEVEVAGNLVVHPIIQVHTNRSSTVMHVSLKPYPFIPLPPFYFSMTMRIDPAAICKHNLVVLNMQRRCVQNTLSVHYRCLLSGRLSMHNSTTESIFYIIVNFSCFCPIIVPIRGMQSGLNCWMQNAVSLKAI